MTMGVTELLALQIELFEQFHLLLFAGGQVAHDGAGIDAEGHVGVPTRYGSKSLLMASLQLVYNPSGRDLRPKELFVRRAAA